MTTMHPTPIVALDVPSAEEARALVSQLDSSCHFYKVGLELYCAAGPDFVRWLRDADKQVFVDLKLHDIPNTVQGAARSVAHSGASLLTVHASGGAEMMRAATLGAREAGHGCTVLGVTVLTSHDAASQGAAWGRPPVDVQAEVLRLAGDALAAGLEGIVCSGHEAALVRERHGDKLGLLIPGIRLAGGAAHDQKRVMTPVAARDAGARWIILGRAVTQAPSPRAAMEAVLGELASPA